MRRVDQLDPATLDGLTDLLIDCVHGGASVSFMAPLSRDTADAFWRRVAADLPDQRRLLLIASDAARLYERLGWIRVGDIPHYALFPDGRPCSTTYYYRMLPPPPTKPARIASAPRVFDSEGPRSTV